MFHNWFNCPTLQLVLEVELPFNNISKVWVWGESINTTNVGKLYFIRLLNFLGAHLVNKFKLQNNKITISFSMFM